MPYWAGIDWSTKGHDVAVVDHEGALVLQSRFDETRDGVRELRATLAGLSPNSRHSARRVPIAIETEQGLLVAELRRLGLTIVPVPPALVARHRGLTAVTRTKDDRADARLLADIARQYGTELRPLRTGGEQAAAVTVLARAQLHAARDRRRAVARLGSLLRDYYPAALAAWSGLPRNLARAEARAVLRLAPTPTKARRMTGRQLALAISGAGRKRQVDAEALRLRALFRQRDYLTQPPTVEEAMGRQVLAHLDVVDAAIDVEQQLTERSEEAFAAHPQASIYLSFPGVGPLLGARLLAEIGDDPDRFTSARGLRAYAAVAPITWSSGSSHRVTRRHVGNARLHAAAVRMAFTALRSPGARTFYDRRRDAGDRHPAAARRLAGRLLTCLYHCLRTRQSYSEARAFPVDASTDTGGGV